VYNASHDYYSDIQDRASTYTHDAKTPGHAYSKILGKARDRFKECRTLNQWRADTVAQLTGIDQAGRGATDIDPVDRRATDLNATHLYRMVQAIDKEVFDGELLRDNQLRIGVLKPMETRLHPSGLECPPGKAFFQKGAVMGEGQYTKERPHLIQVRLRCIEQSLDTHRHRDNDDIRDDYIEVLKVVEHECVHAYLHKSREALGNTRFDRRGGHSLLFLETVQKILGHTSHLFTPQTSRRYSDVLTWRHITLANRLPLPLLLNRNKERPVRVESVPGSFAMDAMDVVVEEEERHRMQRYVVWHSKSIKVPSLEQCALEQSTGRVYNVHPWDLRLPRKLPAAWTDALAANAADPAADQLRVMDDEVVVSAFEDDAR
jgi:hypothetical protein